MHLIPVLAKTNGSGLDILPLIAVLIVIMYFFLIRPQKKQEAKRKEMLGAIKKNDRVLTNGGIYGVVTNIKEDEVTLRIDDTRDVKVKVSRNFIAAVVNKNEGSEAA